METIKIPKEDNLFGWIDRITLDDDWILSLIAKNESMFHKPQGVWFRAVRIGTDWKPANRVRATNGTI